MSDKLPEIKYTFSGNILESERWQHYVPRDDDIIISTSMKSGTTWMQAIVRAMIPNIDPTTNILEISPWLELMFPDIETVIEKLEAQTHRRFIKTHLALDGIPYFPQVKYIVVGRDARDVCMSMWTHYQKFDRNLDNPSQEDIDSGRAIADLKTFWHEFMTRGWNDWETEGFPYWGNMRHTQSWWNFKHLPNIFFVHYQNLLDDTAGQIQKIADYLNIALTSDEIDAIVDKTSFATMKKNADQNSPMYNDGKGNADFFNKGTNGRWNDVLSEIDLELYRAAVARVLTPDCAHWLEHGRLP